MNNEGIKVKFCCICDAPVKTFDSNEEEPELVPHKVITQRSKHCRTVVISEIVVWECPHCKAWNAPEDSEENNNEHT